LTDDFPLAATSLAWVNLIVNKEYGSAGQDSVHRMADLYVKKANEMDPGMPQLHSIRAAIEFYFNWNIKSAEKEARRAVGSGDIQGYAMLCDILIKTLRYDEANDVLKVALELDPLNANLFAKAGVIAMAKNNPDSAGQLFYRALSMDSMNVKGWEGLAGMMIKSGLHADVISLLNRNEVTIPEASITTRSYLAIAYFHAGEQLNALAILNEMEVLWRNKAHTGMAFSLARAYAGIGMNEKAMHWLEHTFQARDAEMMDLLIEPGFTALCDIPRFKEFLRVTGLHKYQ
jgi:tetratricopeptide (TPR) repeat protein